MRLLVPGRSGRARPGRPRRRGPVRGVRRAARIAGCAATWSRRLDGAATGADGRSGRSTTPADHVVFEVLRALSHVVVVGRGHDPRRGLSPAVRARTRSSALRRRARPPRRASPRRASATAGTCPPTLSGCRDGRSSWPSRPRPPDSPGRAGPRRRERPRLRRRRGRRRARSSQRCTAAAGPGPHRGRPEPARLLPRGRQLDELCFTISPQVVGGEHPRRSARDGNARGPRPRAARRAGRHPDGSLVRPPLTTLRGLTGPAGQRRQRRSATLDELRSTRSQRSGSWFHSRQCRAVSQRSKRTRSGRRPASATAGPIGTKSSPSEATSEHRVAQLVRPRHPVGAGHVDRLAHPDEAPAATTSPSGRSPPAPAAPGTLCSRPWWRSTTPQSMTGESRTTPTT